MIDAKAKAENKHIKEASNGKHVGRKSRGDRTVEKPGTANATQVKEGRGFRVIGQTS